MKLKTVIEDLVRHQCDGYWTISDMFEIGYQIEIKQGKYEVLDDDEIPEDVLNREVSIVWFNQNNITIEEEYL